MISDVLIVAMQLYYYTIIIACRHFTNSLAGHENCVFATSYIGRLDFKPKAEVFIAMRD